MSVFKDSAKARTYLRAGVATALAMAAVAGTIWIGNPVVQILSAGLVVVGGYLGVGAAVPSVEPFYGRTMDVDVPPNITVDPAEPTGAP